MRWVVAYSEVSEVTWQLGILKFVLAQDVTTCHVDLHTYFNLKNNMSKKIIVANYPLDSYE